MQLPIALLADYGNISSDGKLNIMGLFTDINASGFPARHPSMFLALKFSLGLGELKLEHTLSVRFEDADGQKIGELTMPLVFARNEQGDRLDHNQLIQLRDLVIPAPGRYQFSVLVDGVLLETVPLKANLVTPQE